MQKLAKLLAVCLGIVALVFVAVASIFEQVPPAKIGVKQNNLGGGIVEEDFLTGFHLGITGVHKWHLLDKTTHFLTYAKQPSGKGLGMERPVLDIRTKDNNFAFFDVTVTYRIKKDEGYMIVKDGNQDKYKTMADTAINKVLRAELAQLSSEEVYDTDTRLALVARAMPILKDELGILHLEPEGLLIRAVNFPDVYETKLRMKQLTQQQKLLATAQRKVEDKQALTEGYEAQTTAQEKEKRGDWDKKLQTESSENEVAIAEISGEAEKYNQETRASAEADFATAVADGELAMAKAQALRDELRNQALNTVGGRIYLARLAAENLRFESVTLNSNDPSIPSIIDIDGLVKLLVGTESNSDD